MNLNRFSADLNNIAVHELSSAARFHLSVDLHVPSLDEELGVSAALGEGRQFEELVKPERFVVTGGWSLVCHRE